MRTSSPPGSDERLRERGDDRKIRYQEIVDYRIEYPSRRTKTVLRLDDQGVALPAPAGVSTPEPDPRVHGWPLVEVNDPNLVVLLVQERDMVRGLEDLMDGRERERHHGGDRR